MFTLLFVCVLFYFFFFKQKTAYEMRISDWSSDVCSSDLEYAVKFGLAVDAKIAERCVFARKHYFYPDLPKGYQISQYELPIVYEGHLDIEVDGKTKRIGITRAHMEEDAGKSMHEGHVGQSGIDLNRAGTPLEIGRAHV